MFIAHVKDGRLVLDAPTDLEEGREVELELVADWADEDDTDEDERAEPLRESDASIADRSAGGRTYSAEEVLAELRGRR